MNEGYNYIKKKIDEKYRKVRTEKKRKYNNIVYLESESNREGYHED